MLAPAPKTQRFLETVQLVLTFVGVCGVVDASLVASPSHDRAGFYARAPEESRAAGDRRIADLARTERKRREAEQQARRHIESERVSRSPANG
jgi:hypothetical protein